MTILTKPTSEAAISRDYKILINKEPAFPLVTRVSAMPFNRLWPGEQRPIEQSELASYISFATDGMTELTVEPSRPFNRCVIRPLSEQITPVIEGKSIRFTLPHPGQYTLELDGPHGALHIFADPYVDFDVKEGNAGVIYFGAGEHHVGQLDLQSNTTVYIDRDAVVHGSILAVGRENVRILGEGALDGGWDTRVTENFLLAYDYARVPGGNWEWEQMNERFRNTPDLFPVYDDRYVKGTGSKLYRDRDHFYRVLDAMKPVKSGIHLYACKNVEVRGIVLRDSAGLSVTQAGCEDVVYDGVKLIGMWRYNSDGIDFYNCRRCTVKNSFLRTFDDTIGIKGQIGWDTEDTSDILVEKCVIWNDWGHALEFGADTVASDISRITFRNCDIIHHTHTALDVNNMDRAHIHDVLFEDIRVEYSLHDRAPEYQHSDDTTFTDTYTIPALFGAQVESNMWSRDGMYGSNETIVFRGVKVYSDEGIPFPPSTLKGHDEMHATRGIRFENITHNGEPIASLDGLNLTCNDYVFDLTIS